MSLRHRLGLSSAAFILASCGGGGGGSSQTPVPPPAAVNSAPVASAGDNFTADIQQTGYAQDGSASSDSDGDALSYSWSIVSRPFSGIGSIQNSNTDRPTLIADAPGDYTLELSVSDGRGGTASDQVIVTLNNQAPVAVLTKGPVDTAVGKTEGVDASGSTDVNGQMLTYNWVVTDAPTDSGLLGEVLLSEEVGDVTFDAIGDYVVSLTVSDGYDSATLDSQSVSVTAYQSTKLDVPVVDAEYHAGTDRLVTVAGNRFNLLDGDGVQTEITLPLVGHSISIVPNGTLAAISHNANMSFVDLDTGVLIGTHTVGANLGDVALDGDGVAHAIPVDGQWVQTYSVSSDGIVKSGSGTVRHQTQLRLHPNGEKIYGANRGLSPSDIERYDIVDGALNYVSDSPYHGDYPFCGNLWFGPGGGNLLTACGTTVQTSDNSESDMTFQYSLDTTGIDWASYVGGAREWAVIGGTNKRQVQYFDLDTGVFRRAVPIEDESIEYVGLRLFPSNAEGGLIVLAADNEASGENAIILKQYAKPTTATDFEPVVVAEKIQSTVTGNAVRLDASGSYDPKGLSLDYKWMLIDEPDGSAITFTGGESDAVEFTPSVSGTYKFSLRLDNGQRQSQIATIEVDAFAPNETLVRRLDADVLHSTFDENSDRFLYIDREMPNVLNLLSPASGDIEQIILPAPGYRIGVSDDGTKTIVSHSGAASLIDLTIGEVIDFQNVSAAWGDVAVSNNGVGYLIPSRDQWTEFYSIDFANDQVLQQWGARAGSRLYMGVDQDRTYSITVDSSPEDITRWDVSNPVNGVSAVDSPYHGDYSMGANFWISKTGTQILTEAGTAFATGPTAITELGYVGALSGNRRAIWADHSDEFDMWAVAGYTGNGEEQNVGYFDRRFLTQSRTLGLEPIPTLETSADVSATQVFLSNDSAQTFVVLSSINDGETVTAIQVSETPD